MSPLRVLWAAFVGLYDETIALVGGNVAWLLTGIPPLAVLTFLLVTFVPLEGEASAWPIAAAALLLLFVPTPGALALGDLARTTASGEAPVLRGYWSALARTWRLGSRLFVASVLGFALLAVYFYASVASGPARLLAIIWIYALLFWLGMQFWVVPLALHLDRPRVFDIYRRAALLTLGNMPFTFILVIGIFLLDAASVALVPLYLTAIGAFAALVEAFAFRALRRRHGDLPDEDARVGAA